MSQIDKSTTPKLGAKDSADNYNLLIEDFDSEELTNTAKKNGISPKEQARMLLQQNKDYLIDSDYKSASEYINKNL
jgi:hypothetical protein